MTKSKRTVKKSTVFTFNDMWCVATEKKGPYYAVSILNDEDGQEVELRFTPEDYNAFVYVLTAFKPRFARKRAAKKAARKRKNTAA